VSSARGSVIPSLALRVGKPLQIYTVTTAGSPRAQFALRRRGRKVNFTPFTSFHGLDAADVGKQQAHGCACLAVNSQAANIAAVRHFASAAKLPQSKRKALTD
jgi:hypothetical protein